MAQFTKYSSADVGSPTLSGSVGRLVAVLKACLVDGYGSKASVGWTQPYTDTNRAAFRPLSGSRFFYEIEDNAGGLGGAKEARLRGYETMSAIAVGTGPFPTSGQMAAGLYIRKSTAADSTIRQWKIFADNRTAYVFISTGDAANTYSGFMIGDFYSLVAGDLYNGAIIARVSENSATSSNDKLDIQQSSLMAVSQGHYSARSYIGTIGGHNFARAANYQYTAGSPAGALPFPNPADASLRLLRNYIADISGPQNSLRGWARGLWAWGHPIAMVNDGDIYSGSGDLAGKTFELIKSTGSAGVLAIETSNTLDTN